MKNNNKYALVTGASRGIGKAIAIALAKDGYNIIIHYNQRQDEAGNTAKKIEELGKMPFLVQADLTQEPEINNMFKSISKYTKYIDCLVNNAGFDISRSIEEYTMEEIRKVVELILFSKISITRHTLPFLKRSESPCIINIASRLGKEKTIKGASAYSAAQAGVIKFTQTSALEFAEYKIRVNCITPGLTKTDLTKSIYTSEGFQEAAEANPMGRVGEPEDIANLTAFLVSAKASYINGEIIGVNGGSNLV